MISIDEINLLVGQNEALKKQNQELQKEIKILSECVDTLTAKLKQLEIEVE